MAHVRKVLMDASHDLDESQLKKIGWSSCGDGVLIADKPYPFGIVNASRILWVSDEYDKRFLVAIENPLDVFHEYSWVLRQMSSKEYFVWDKMEYYEKV